jgi:hypothetical protein
VEYPQLLSYLRAFDVGIMPHLSNSMTEKMNPLKLYNHFGAGIPIVSTEVANLEDLRSYVRTASNPDTFIAAIEACLAESASLGTTEREEILKRISRTCNGHRNPRHYRSPVIRESGVNMKQQEHSTSSPAVDTAFSPPVDAVAIRPVIVPYARGD